MKQTPITWRTVLRQNFTRWEPLADFLQLTEEQRKYILKRSKFPLNLPLRLAEKIQKGTLEDPILRQFLPTQEELINTNGFVAQPVQDAIFKKAPKLLHKYTGRALLVCTSACAMNCRFCFRQNFDYAVEPLYAEEIQILNEDSSISEVILSGGDPLSLSDETLKKLLDALAEIPHIQRIRFHTRFPIGIPERIDDSFLALLKAIPKQIWFVIHANHAAELDAEVLQRLKSLQQIGVVVLNQSVLLKGVNDTVPALKDLCERLVNHGILPYYLHQLDQVQGAAHFEVSEEEGRQLINTLSQQISGYAVPKYVREIPGEPGKTNL